jgi:two-component system response regulator AtoC
LAIVDICLSRSDPNNKDGLEFISYITEEQFDIPFIVLSGYEQQDMPEVMRESFKSGAIDYIQKSRLTPTFLRKLVDDTIDKSSLRRQVHHWKNRLRQLEDWEIIGECPEIRRVKEDIVRVAEDGYISVLITGETGTGKELAARAIHQKGWRKDEPFKGVNVSALSPELVHRELFGNEKGAFTGAGQAKAGYIEAANRGLLFIDEIAEMPQDSQKLFLRVLEEKRVYRIGSTRGLEVDFQLVSATNKDLKEVQAKGDFRADLYYRLTGESIHLPPLRERGDDVLLLANYFLDQFRRQGRTLCHGLSAEVEKALLNYSWPGNIRELRNVIERAIIRSTSSQGNLIQLESLPEDILSSADESLSNVFSIKSLRFPLNLKRERDRQTLILLESALKEAGGLKTEYWKLLGFKNRWGPSSIIESILKRHPDLFDEVPYLTKQYDLMSTKTDHRSK